MTKRVFCRTTDQYGAEASLGPEASDLEPWVIDPATPAPPGSPARTPAPVLARYWPEDEDVDAIVTVNPATRRGGGGVAHRWGHGSDAENVGSVGVKGARDGQPEPIKALAKRCLKSWKVASRGSPAFVRA